MEQAWMDEVIVITVLINSGGKFRGTTEQLLEMQKTRDLAICMYNIIHSN